MLLLRLFFGSCIFNRQGNVSRPKARGAQPHRRLVEQLVSNGVATVLRAQLGWEDVALTDGLLMLELRILEILAPQPVPELLAVDAAPDAIQILAVERQKLRHRPDALLLKSLLHAGAHARQIAQREIGER